MAWGTKDSPGGAVSARVTGGLRGWVDVVQQQRDGRAFGQRE